MPLSGISKQLLDIVLEHQPSEAVIRYLHEEHGIFDGRALDIAFPEDDEIIRYVISRGLVEQILDEAL